MYFQTMDIKDNRKINILSATLSVFFGENMNLVRIKFFNLFIFICTFYAKFGLLCFEKLVASLPIEISNIKVTSKETMFTLTLKLFMIYNFYLSFTTLISRYLPNSISQLSSKGLKPPQSKKVYSPKYILLLA